MNAINKIKINGKEYTIGGTGLTEADKQDLVNRVLAELREPLPAPTIHISGLDGVVLTNIGAATSATLYVGDINLGTWVGISEGLPLMSPGSLDDALANNGLTGTVRVYAVTHADGYKDSGPSEPFEYYK